MLPPCICRALASPHRTPRHGLAVCIHPSAHGAPASTSPPHSPRPQKAGNLAAHSIAALLVEGTGLRQVGLASLQVPTHLWLGKVLPALSVAGRLVSADLSGNYVTDEVCVELAKQLPQMETLKVGEAHFFRL